MILLFDFREYGIEIGGDVVWICNLQLVANGNNPDYLNIRILNPIIMLFAHCKC